MFVFGFFKNAIAYTLEWILRKIRQGTSFRVRKCLLGIAYLIFRPLYFRTTAILETHFDWKAYSLRNRQFGAKKNCYVWFWGPLCIRCELCSLFAI